MEKYEVAIIVGAVNMPEYCCSGRQVSTEHTVELLWWEYNEPIRENILEPRDPVTWKCCEWKWRAAHRHVLLYSWTKGPLFYARISGPTGGEMESQRPAVLRVDDYLPYWW